jgi:uncharacterized Zn-binding protein involved in type VI secretion
MTAKKLSRKGDKNTTGGVLQEGVKTVFANNKPVATHPNKITPHSPPKPSIHKNAVTTEGSPTVFAENKPVVRVDTPNNCGHKIVEGSENVFVP